MGDPEGDAARSPQALRQEADRLEREAAEAEKYIQPKPAKYEPKGPGSEYNPNASLEPEAVAFRKRQAAKDLRREADELELRLEDEARQRQEDYARQAAEEEEQRREIAELEKEDTGHYDDGHAFGWRKEKPLADPTGHYDDGHGFGWQKPKTEADEPPVSAGGFGGAAPRGLHPAPTGLAAVAFTYLRQRRSLQVGVAVAVLVGLLLGTEMLRAGAAQQTQLAPPTAATSATVAPATAAVVRASAGPLDPCALVTVQEAAAILGGQSVTARGTTPPGAQCDYHAAQRVIFSFQESSRVAQIRIDDVVLTVITGSQAASRYAAKASPKPDPDNQPVTGVGDKAIYGGAAGDLSVLRGSTYVNVAVQGDNDWGNGTTRYEDVFQKYLSILVAFAQDALARAP